jgi:hypothetical protein
MYLTETEPGVYWIHLAKMKLVKKAMKLWAL